MSSYILRRVLLFIPGLFLVSLFTFFLSKQVPNDSVDQILELNGIESYLGDGDSYQIEYEKISKAWHLDKPNFYFSVAPQNYPKSLNKYLGREHREKARDLFKRGLNERQVDLFFANGQFPTGYIERSCFPKFHWHGTKNQYHLWVSNLLNKKSNISILDGRSVSTKISEALPWTISLVLMTLILCIGLSILLGGYLSSIRHSLLESVISVILYLSYSIPVFWLATVFIVFFTSPQYGDWLNWFPSAVHSQYNLNDTGERNYINIVSQLTLPILCLTLHYLSYVTTHVKSSLDKQMIQDYIVTAKSKGLSLIDTIRVHGLRNALIPIITIFIAAIPQAFVGSLVVEIIFNIPGMGRLIYASILSADWNVVFSVLLIVSFITMISYLLGDILYAMANPKIRFSK